MTRASRLTVLALLLCGALALTGAAVTAAAPKPPSKYQVRTRIAKLQIDLAGYLETRALHDTTSDCFPGERWIKTNRFEFETGRFVDVSVKNVSLPGTGQSVVTSNFSRSSGSATSEGLISGYESTNNCPPTAPVKLGGPPACAKNRGAISVGLTPGDIPESDGELTPLNGRPLLVTIKRNGGGRDATQCVGEGASRLTGKDTDLAVATTSIAPGVAAILPANLDAIKVFAIRKKQTIKRVIQLSGSCKSVAVKALVPPGTTPNPGSLNADGDCWMTGKIVVTIRPRG